MRKRDFWKPSCCSDSGGCWLGDDVQLSSYRAGSFLNHAVAVTPILAYAAGCDFGGAGLLLAFRDAMGLLGIGAFKDFVSIARFETLSTVFPTKAGGWQMLEGW